MARGKTAALCNDFLADPERKTGGCVQICINVRELPLSLLTHVKPIDFFLVDTSAHRYVHCSTRFPVVFPISCLKLRKYRSDSRCTFNYTTNHTLLSVCQDQTAQPGVPEFCFLNVSNLSRRERKRRKWRPLSFVLACSWVQACTCLAICLRSNQGSGVVLA